MFEPKHIPPNQIGDELRAREWNTASLGPQVFAVVCPLCGSLVAAGAPANGITYQEAHIRDHEWVGGKR